MPQFTAEEKLHRGGVAAAKDKNEHINNKKVSKKLREKTIETYEGVIKLWETFVKQWEEEETERSALNPETARRKSPTLNGYEGPKEFLDRIALGIEGNLGIKEPSVQTVLNNWKCLAAGKKLKGDPVNPEVNSSTRQFILNELRGRRKLPWSKHKKGFGTSQHLFHLQDQLWRKDTYQFKYPGGRLDFAAEMLANIYAAGRAGEFIESSARAGSGRGLHFRDIKFCIFRNEKGEAEFTIENEKDGKGMTDLPDKRGRHSMHEGPVGCPPPLFSNPIFIHLPIIVSKGAFEDYDSVEELLDLPPPDDNEMHQLHWKIEMLDQPLYQRGDGQIDSATTYCSRLRALALRAGYTSFTNHYFRRECLHQIDELYSTAQLMKQAGHRDQNTFREHYAPQNPGTDGQAAYFGDKPRQLVNNLLRSMTVARNPDLWQSLPAERQHEIEEREDFRELDEQLVMLSLEGNKHNSREDRKRLNTKKRKIISEELQKLQREQVAHYKPGLKAGRVTESGHCRLRFERIAPLMPVRKRLAESMFCCASIRDPEGRAALKDLMELYNMEKEVSFRPGLDLGKCRCDASLGRSSNFRGPSWKHVLSCHRKAHRKQNRFAEFCFFCSEWFYSSTTWAAHCEEHVEDIDTMPTECNPFNYGGSLATPGLCPWCLGDESLDATVRMRQFLDRAKWQDHVEEHLKQLKCKNPESFVCPYPSDKEFQTLQKLEFHLMDNHCWIPRKAKKSSDSSLVMDNEDPSTITGLKRCSPECETKTKLRKLSRGPV